MSKKKSTPLPLPLPTEGFVRLPQILHALGIGRTTFLERVKAGKYPDPIPMGKRMKVWRIEEIRALIHHIGQEKDDE